MPRCCSPTPPWICTPGCFGSATASPKREPLEAVQALESVLKRDPDNIGANHFYIHVMEESPHPEQAMASARKMADLAPGAGHLVHMPAHIYIRTGDYHAASVSNKQAMGADQGYIEKYHVREHVLDDVLHAQHAFPGGEQQHGRQFRRRQSRGWRESPRASRRILKDHPEVQSFLPTQTFVLVRFRRWAEIEAASRAGQEAGSGARVVALRARHGV